MNKLINWIKSHKIGFVLIIFTLPLFIIFLLFKWYWGCNLLIPPWDASDIISYIVGFETFVGTIFLGIIANAMNERMYKDNELQNRFQRQPSVMLYDWDMKLIPIYFDNFNGAPYCLCNGYSVKGKNEACLVRFTLINSSNIYSEIKIISLTCESDGSDPLQWGRNTYTLKKKDVFHIAPSCTEDIKFLLNKEYYGKLNDKTYKLELLLTNCMGEQYLETIRFDIFLNYENFFHVNVKEYAVNKFKEKAGIPK